MLSNAGLLKKFWIETINSNCYLDNKEDALQER